MNTTKMSDAKTSGVDRIHAAFQKGRPAFMPYSVLGYPNREAGMETVRQVAAAGADLLELGIPFSDPLADGPTIQEATQKSLDNGTTVKECLQMTKTLRAEGMDTPAVFMGYVNPMMAYGLKKFVKDAVDAGIDGLIVPDLPPEEADELEEICDTYGIALIHFLAPTSTPERIKLVTSKAKGFIYLVSVTGITGARQDVASDLGAFVDRVRAETDIPLAVGFGIGNGEQAKAVGGLADGVIVGSALVKCALVSPEAVYELAHELREAL